MNDRIAKKHARQFLAGAREYPVKVEWFSTSTDREGVQGSVHPPRQSVPGGRQTGTPSWVGRLPLERPHSAGRRGRRR